MPRLILKNLFARKWRTLMTALAVVIGIALVAGTYVLTDTTNQAFDEIFEDSLKGTDVVVTAKSEVEQQDASTPAFPARYLKTVKGLPGVGLAAGTIFSPGAILNPEGDEIGSGFAPKFISSALPGPLESLEYVDGHQPRGPREASLDEAGAEAGDVEIGDTLTVVGTGRARPFELVGLTRLGGASFGGTTIVQLSIPAAQRVTGKLGEFDQISIKAEPGVSPERLERTVREALPESLRVETAAENADRQSNEIEEGLSFLNIALLVFGLIALIVGAFVIFNVFSITVAQRTREFGMLRTLGASRGQVLRSVLAEGLLVGLLGSIVGIGVGILLAKGLSEVLAAAGADLPSTSMVVAGRTIVVSLVLGIGITLVSACVPAIRSTRVPPIAALTEGELPAGKRRNLLRGLVAGLFAAAGLAAIGAGLFGGAGGGEAAGLLGGGAFALILAISIFSPALVKPMASAIGAPLVRIGGLTGRLARENSQRKPSRTAVTAAALMIGLALVTFVTIFASGVKSSISSVIDDNFEGEIVLQSTGGFTPIPTAAVSEAGKVPGVAVSSGFRTAQAKLLDGIGTRTITSVQPESVVQVLELEWEDGSEEDLASLADDELVVGQSLADDQGLEVGDRVRMLTQTGARPTFTVKAVMASGNLDFLGAGILTQAAVERDFGVDSDTNALVKVDSGESVDAVQDRVSKALEKPFPTVEVLNQAQVKDDAEQQVNGLLSLIYVLLALAIVVSLVGIVVTLILSIHERTRELGMLRAVGMSRRQVRRMIRYEAVITGVIGAVLGVVLGAILAALVGSPLEEEGFTLTYPVGTLLLIVVLGAVVGVLAAVYPARKASKLDVLESISYE